MLNERLYQHLLATFYQHLTPLSTHDVLPSEELYLAVTKALFYRPLCWKCTGNWWIPHTKGQHCGECVHVILYLRVTLLWWCVSTGSGTICDFFLRNWWHGLKYFIGDPNNYWCANVVCVMQKSIPSVIVHINLHLYNKLSMPHDQELFLLTWLNFNPSMDN